MLKPANVTGRYMKMNSNELKSIPPHTAFDQYTDEGAAMPQTPTRRQSASYWAAFLGTVALVSALLVWSVRAPGQDHFASIPLDHDGSWYYNYEVGFEIQDPE